MTYREMLLTLQKMTPKQLGQEAVIVLDGGYCYASVQSLQCNDKLCEILNDDTICIVSSDDVTSKL